MNGRRAVAGFWVAGIALAAALSAATVFLPIQITLVLLGVVLAVCLATRNAVIVAVVLLVPTLSLVRRVAAGKAAYLESDPLILLPILLAVGVVIVSWGRARTDSRTSYARVLAMAVIIGVAAAVAGFVVFLPFLLYPKIREDQVQDLNSAAH